MECFIPSLTHPKTSPRGCQAAFAAALALAGATLAAAQPATQAPPGSVVVATNNWASQVVGANVIKALLERVGHRVELKPVAIDLQLAALGEGELHVQGEVRESVMREPVDELVAKRRVLRAGNHEAVSREGWWYPEYVQDLCKGLPAWQELKRCARLFDPAAGGTGRFLTGPKSWRHRDRERIEALGLPFSVAHADSAGALLTELERAWAARRPIVLFRWSPHWMDVRYAGRFIEFPAFDPHCITDPSWGPNPRAIYDCDLHPPAPISKLVWSGLPRRHPCAFELTRRVSFSSRDLASMEEMTVVHKLGPEEAAERWLRDNEARWRRWIPPCRAKA